MHKQTLIAWLKRAHTMETQSLPILHAQMTDARKDFPARARFQAHIRETEQHAARMSEALASLGSAPVRGDGDGNAATSIAMAITTRFFSDPLARLAIADFIAEQFEVSAYTALIAAAEQAGENEVARLCRLNRGEDEDMAEWLDAQIPMAVERALTALPLGRR
jgi:ferritin-like metal-binding protein YciE